MEIVFAVRIKKRSFLDDSDFSLETELSQAVNAPDCGCIVASKYQNFSQILRVSTGGLRLYRGRDGHRIPKIYFAFSLFSSEDRQIFNRRAVFYCACFDVEDASVMGTVHFVVEDHGLS